MLDDLQGIIDANPGSDLADKVENALDKAVQVSDELDKSPPDREAAIGILEGAVGDLEAALDSGLFSSSQEGIDLLDALVNIARRMTTAAIAEATNNGGDPNDLLEAQQSLNEGDDKQNSNN